MTNSFLDKEYFIEQVEKHFDSNRYLADSRIERLVLENLKKRKVNLSRENISLAQRETYVILSRDYERSNDCYSKKS